jgi:hypothetical protein
MGRMISLTNICMDKIYIIPAMLRFWPILRDFERQPWEDNLLDKNGKMPAPMIGGTGQVDNVAMSHVVMVGIVG